MFRSSSISAVVTATKTIASLVRYCINGVSGHNRPVYVNKLRRLFLFKPADIVMKTLEATNQLGGFNQRLPTRHPNKKFLYIGPHQHEDDIINTSLSYIRAQYGIT